MKSRLRSIVLSIFATSLMAQTASGEVRFKQNQQRQTIALSGLADAPRCSPRDFVGTIVKRDFGPDALTLSGIVIEREDGTRDFINLVPPSGLDMATHNAMYDGLQRLTKIGRKAEGRALACGAAGRVEFLDDIR